MQQVWIFCHGWGGSVNFWNNLQGFFQINQLTTEPLQTRIFLDLGYFGQAIEITRDLATDNSIEFIGIGHSLGLIKLLSLGIKFKALIGLNSFINFLGNSSELQASRIKELNLIRNKFLVDPATTLINFYQSIGVGLEKKQLTYLNKNKLNQDLNLLYTANKLPSETPLLVVGSANDVIVPPKLIYDNFQQLPKVNIEVLAAGGHGLGCLEIEMVWQKIASFLYVLNKI